MNIQSAFSQLLVNSRLDSKEVISTVNALTKKLNSVYYDSNSETNHMVFAGSFGRGTANIYSDVDYCFVLPQEVYKRFNNRKGNIQSQLLTEVKNKLETRYPNTKINGDGQVVDVNFKKRTIELVPCFSIDYIGNGFIYPNTNNDGSWLMTNPINQHEVVKKFSALYPLYKDICKIIRCWKAQCGVRIKGIVIDCLVKRFLDITSIYKGKKINEVDVLELLKCFFNYLANNCPNQIQIIGESEFLDIDKNAFKRKSLKAIKKLDEDDCDLLWNNCIELFGDKFPRNPIEDRANSSEEFISDKFRVRITNNVSIDCKISADGFQTIFLKQLLNTVNCKYVVEQSKSLDFKITECDVEKPYDIYWKVRNVGSEAIKKNMIRGKIEKGNSTHHECSQFHGPHYVECFIVKDGTCVAKTRLNVPIV